MGDTHPTPAENTSELSARLEGKEPDLEVLGTDIDKRLKALNADQIEMGARPKTEPKSTDLYPPAYPIPGSKTIEPGETAPRSAAKAPATKTTRRKKAAAKK